MPPPIISRLLRRWIFVLAVLLLHGCTLESSTLTVSRVVDGDTFELSDGRTVRLIGIDTPEKHYSDKLERDAERTGQDIETIQSFGRKAADYAEQLAARKHVELEFDPANADTGHRDRYDRVLAYVWVLDAEGKRRFSVNARMLREGYAAAYTQYPFKNTDYYLRLQREARENERGLWAVGMEEAVPVES